MRQLRITQDDQYRLLAWAAPKCGLKGKWPDETVALGVEDDSGTLQAVFCYNAFYDEACSAHVASNHTRAWATPRIMKAVFGYPFVLLKLRRINLMVPENNQAATIVAIKMGFKVAGVMRGGAPDHSDAIIFGMLAQECRWIK